MREVKLENSLAYKRPDLAKEWNYEKNGDLKPEGVTLGSERKIYWNCDIGHVWEAKVCKKVYIGKTRQKQRRFTEHKNELRNNRHPNQDLQTLFNQHG